MTENKEVGLQAPWILYFRRLQKLFEYDGDVVVRQNDHEGKDIKIYVKGIRKYDALCKLLPKEKQFGNITVKVEIVPANKEQKETWVEVFEDAFKGNPVFKFGKHESGQLGTFDYVVFTAVAAQYYSDNLFDIKGCTTELYQEIAKDIFDVGEDAVCYCSDVPPVPCDY